VDGDFFIWTSTNMMFIFCRYKMNIEEKKMKTNENQSYLHSLYPEILRNIMTNFENLHTWKMKASSNDQCKREKMIEPQVFVKGEYERLFH
jgi:hypothetical protein